MHLLFPTLITPSRRQSEVFVNDGGITAELDCVVSNRDLLAANQITLMIVNHPDVLYDTVVKMNRIEDAWRARGNPGLPADMPYATYGSIATCPPPDVSRCCYAPLPRSTAVVSVMVVFHIVASMTAAAFMLAENL